MRGVVFDTTMAGHSPELTLQFELLFHSFF